MSSATGGTTRPGNTLSAIAAIRHNERVAGLIAQWG
jgi:hypothetical protein